MAHLVTVWSVTPGAQQSIEHQNTLEPARWTLNQHLAAQDDDLAIRQDDGVGIRAVEGHGRQRLDRRDAAVLGDRDEVGLVGGDVAHTLTEGATVSTASHRQSASLAGLCLSYVLVDHAYGVSDMTR